MNKYINEIILSSLLNGDKYGLEITKEIKNHFNLGEEIKLQNLYNSIKRLETKGYIKSYWENSEIGGKRRYCSLTENGKHYLETTFNEIDEEEIRFAISNLLNNSNLTEEKNTTDAGEIDKNLPNENRLSATHFNKAEIAIQPSFFNELNTNECSDKVDNNLCSVNSENQIDFFTCLKQCSESANSTNVDKNTMPNSAKTNSNVLYESINKEFPNVNKSKIENNVNYETLINFKEAKAKLFDKPKENTQTLEIENEDANLYPTNKDEFKVRKQDIVETKKTNKKILNECSSDFFNQNTIKFEKTPLEQKSSNQNCQLDSYPLTNIDKCLKDFNECGIKWNIYSVMQYSQNINTASAKIQIAKSNSEYYVNRFNLIKSIFSFIPLIVVLIALYIGFEFKIGLTQQQKICFLVVASIGLFYVLVSLMNVVISPRKVKQYSKTKSRHYKLILLLFVVITLILLSACWFCGMTFQNIEKFIVYFVLPVVIMLYILANIGLKSLMARQKLCFVKISIN